MKDSDRLTTVRRLFEGVLNGRDLDAIEEIYAPGCVVHPNSAVRSVLRGIQARKEAVREARVAFRDLTYRIEDLIAEGNRVACRWSCSGVHAHEYLGVPPSGLPTTWQGMTLFRFAGDVIAEEWWAYDDFCVFQELIGARQVRRVNC